MTVKELKEMLQDLPDDDIIYWYVDKCIYYDLHHITREIRPNKTESVYITLEHD